MDSTMDAEMCLLCDKPLLPADKTTVIKEKQVNNFIKKSKARQENDWQKWEGNTCMTVHENCRLVWARKRDVPPSKKRKTISNETVIEASNCDSSGTSQMSMEDAIDHDDFMVQEDGFDFVNNCFICAQPAYGKQDCVQIVTDDCLSYYSRLRAQSDVAEDRRILTRLLSRDPNQECRYHKKCKNKFLSSKIGSGPSQLRNDSKKIDKIVDKVCHYMETSGRFRFDMDEIDCVIGEETVSCSIFFDRLKKRLGTEIDIVKGKGRKTVLFYKLSCDTNIFHKCILNEGEIDEFEKKKILTTAAQILVRDITPTEKASDKYPPPANFLDDINFDVPQSMREFMECMLTREKVANMKTTPKVDMLCHSLMTLIKPSFSSKLQLALGIYILRKTGKRQIIDLLYKLGVCASYDAVQLFESSAVMDPPIEQISEGAFVQFVFDNTDHNVSTLDGKETFHCLGGIAVYTPEHALSFEGGSKKLKTMPKAADIPSQHQIPIVPFGGFGSDVLKNVVFRSTRSMKFEKPPVLSSSYGAYLWSRSLRVPGVPSWKGFMEFLCSDIEYEKSVVLCQPFINLPPSDYTTINTALHFAAEECRKLNVHTCFVTFDQPLYYKARCIVDEGNNDKLKNVQVRLGGFHLLMSYFGSIGITMDGSGLEELWSEIYAENSVKQMMSGHAFARALRAHVLTFTAIGIYVCRMIDVTLAEKDHFFNLFEGLWNASVIKDSSAPPDINRSLVEDARATLKTCDTDETVKRLTISLITKMSDLEVRGPTAKLWSQYFKCVTTALQFVEAERLGNFKLHLQSLREMLPLFHATGHFAYAKCGQIYLQDSEELEVKMPDVEFQAYASRGYFTIRRSDKPWSGVWSDMSIETTLNRFFGTDLTHGRGVTPSVVTRYLAAMPSAFSIMENLEEYCGVRTSTSEQHADLNKSRRERDFFDVNKLLSWIDAHEPFAACTDLKSLGSGLIADKTINCHLAIEKGEQSMEKMVGKTITQVALARTCNVKPLSAMKNSMHLNDLQLFAVDTSLLFQRLLASTDFNDIDKTREAFSYELSPFPLSLFDDEGLMRKSTKSDLYKIMTPATDIPSSSEFQYVVDGGFLLRKVVWPHSANYLTLFSTYLDYIVKYYGNDCVVVFDGYCPQVIGTKSYERYRRKEKIAAAVEIMETSLVAMSQQKFLSNIMNKYNFVALLSEFLEKSHVKTKIAVEDADVLIVQTARNLAISGTKPVAVIGNDIDLLVLMIALIPSTTNAYFQKVVPGSKGDVLYSISDNAHLRQYVLFAHAFSGSDTTNAFFHKGKKKLFAVFAKNTSLIQTSDIFCKSFEDFLEEEMNTDFAISEDGLREKFIQVLLEEAEKIIFYLYESPYEHGSNVNELRYRLFCKSADTSKKHVSLAMLPPTRDALKQHVKRVYLQVQAWLGKSMEPTQWGWKNAKNILFPVMTTQTPAPDELLRQISCACRSNCRSKQCTCKKAGLLCTRVCKMCNGDSCENASTIRQQIHEYDLFDDTIEAVVNYQDYDTDSPHDNNIPDTVDDSVYNFESD